MPTAALDLYLPAAGDTEFLGAALARTRPPADLGAVLYLHGDLGAGKTTCVRSLLHALGITRPVRSPTYTLIENYACGDLTCIHVDLYRLGGAAEAEDLGLRELAVPRCLLLVEWPERGGSAVPPADLELLLSYESPGRLARLTGVTPQGNSWVAKLGDDASLRRYVSNKT